MASNKKITESIQWFGCMPFLFLLLCVQPLSARNYRLSRWHIPKADYSGITPLGGNRYAVVSDEEQRIGFYVWEIIQDSITGKILDIRNEGFRGMDWSTNRDAEGIAFCAHRHSVFVSGEADQRIVEHRLDGTLTGAELRVPSFAAVQNIQSNRGFEALGYDSHSRLFWTVTESPLLADAPLQLRLMSFGVDLELAEQYAYTLDAPQARSKGKDYYHGVVAITPVADGRLLLLEREARIASRYNGSRCWCKVFLYDPVTGEKTLVDSWSTRFHLFNTRFSNYEGMCLGPLLADGTQTLFLLCDSQSGYGRGPWRLRDRLKVIRFNTH